MQQQHHVACGSSVSAAKNSGLIVVVGGGQKEEVTEMKERNTSHSVSYLPSKCYKTAMAEQPKQNVTQTQCASVRVSRLAREGVAQGAAALKRPRHVQLAAAAGGVEDASG